MYFYLLLLLSIHKKDRIVFVFLGKQRWIFLIIPRSILPNHLLLLVSTIQKMNKGAFVLSQLQPGSRDIDGSYNSSDHYPLFLSLFEVFTPISDLLLSYFLLEIAMLIVVLIENPSLLCKCLEWTFPYGCFFRQLSLVLFPLFIFDMLDRLFAHRL